MSSSLITSKFCSNKNCGRLDQLLDFSEFTPIKNTNKFMSRCNKCRSKDTVNYNRRNKEKAKERFKRWKDNNPEKYKLSNKRHYQSWKNLNPEKKKKRKKNATLKKRYGITLEQYNNLLEEQNKKCFLCKNEKKLVLDHDHASGKIRKFLCDGCNKGLGFFKDDIDCLLAAVNYLKRYK